jgi:hypothetical protein
MPFLILGSRNTLETHLKEQETNKRKHFVPLGFEANALLNAASAPNRLRVTVMIAFVLGGARGKRLSFPASIPL